MLCDCAADKYQLWDNIRLNTRVTGAFYDEDKAVWRLSTAAGEEEEVQVLVLAQGMYLAFLRLAVGTLLMMAQCEHMG